MMKYLPIALFASALFFAGMQAAQASKLGCTFTKECLEVDECQDTNFSLTLKLLGDASKLISDSETIDAKYLSSQDETVTGAYAIRQNGDVHVVTIHEQTARYSVQMPASGVALYYLGLCKGEQ